MKTGLHKLSTEDIVRRMEHMPKTIECGLHSGIPLCCVEFYAAVWIFSTHDSEFRIEHRKLMDFAPNADKAYYIRCPECCRTGNFVRTLPCPDGPCWHREEQAGEFGI